MGKSDTAFIVTKRNGKNDHEKITHPHASPLQFALNGAGDRAQRKLQRIDITGRKKPVKINQKSTVRVFRADKKRKEKNSMTEQTELTEAYDAATAETLAALDEAHIALVHLQDVKRQIAGRVSDLGMVGIAGRDGQGKNLAKAVEAAVLLNVENVGSLHGHIMTARTLLLGTSPDLSALANAGLTVYDWQSEFNGIIPVER